MADYGDESKVAYSSARDVDMPPYNGMVQDIEQMGTSEKIKDIDAGQITEYEHEKLIEILHQTVKNHELDPNFPAALLDRARQIIASDSEGTSHDRRDSVIKIVQEIEREEDLLLNNSAYPEVRAVVDPIDDPNTPVNTFRAWFLGIIFTFIGTGLDQFFSLRYPGIFISSFVAQLLAYPIGVAMAKVLPKKSFKVFGYEMSLNPGPFNQKEHILITVMSNVSYGGANGTAYVTYIFQVLKLDIFYGERALADSAGFQILLALSTQLIGYGTAGLTRRFLVYPPIAIWPKALAQIALNKALHNDNGQTETGTWRLSRFKFFLICFVSMFIYFWGPNYAFPTLSYFNWMTWISPSNLNLAIVTGSLCGFGFNPWPTFDWNIASYIIDPIITPWFALVNVVFGFFFIGAAIILPMYYTNVWNTGYFPPTSNYIYDNTGSTYNITRVLNPDYSLNIAAYEAYSPAYLAAANCLLYSAFFAIYMSTLVYVGLYHRQELYTGVRSIFEWKNARDAHNDVHNRLMRAYKEVPEWWYLLLLAIAFGMSCACVEVWHTTMPIWGLAFAIGLTLVLQIPIGIIQAVTNLEVTNNVIAEFVGGYAIPNKPIANMIFKAYGYIACAQSVSFASDLKMGHYLKVPPRTMFTAQVAATIVGAFVSIGVNAWQLNNIQDICQPDQSASFTCPGSHTFFTASVIWGAIGPRRIYGDGGLYHPLTYGFVVGAVLPIPFYLWVKWRPNSWVRYVHVPLFLYGGLNWAPYNFSFVMGSLWMGLLFNFFIKRRYPNWWQKYAYVLTTSFGVGIAISAVIIFFAVQYKPVNVPAWWGNTISFAGVDGGSIGTCTLKQVDPAIGHF